MDILPQHTYATLRVDGKGFSKLTKPLRQEGPFHEGFTDAMEAMAWTLAAEVSGAVAAFVGSDEVSVVFQDLEAKAEKWLGGRRDKVVSLSAALATSSFQAEARRRGVLPQESFPLFDSRVLPLGPEPAGPREYLLERMRSVANNSVTMLAHHHLGTQGIVGLGTREKLEKLRVLGDPWEALPLRDRFGTLLLKRPATRTVVFEARGERGQATVTRAAWYAVPLTEAGPWEEHLLEDEALLPLTPARLRGLAS